jgi:hypothetical protein
MSRGYIIPGWPIIQAGEPLWYVIRAKFEQKPNFGQVKFGRFCIIVDNKGDEQPLTRGAVFADKTAPGMRITGRETPCLAQVDGFPWFLTPDP